MTVLITGGAGFIGSHTCAELLESGYNIVVVDNFSNSSLAVLQRVKKITGKTFSVYAEDMCNKDTLRTIFREHNIDTVLHFAGVKAVGESVSHPMKYYRNNMIATIHLCEIMQEYGVKKLIFSSSATVYDQHATMPLVESATLQAVNPYGRTKQMIETFLEDLSAANSDWCISILRYFNPIGAHKSGLIGEDPIGTPNNLLPYIAQVAVGRRDYLSIYGDDYATRDGTGIRDYIHVVDLAKGHVRALERVRDMQGVEFFNLGTGLGYSVFDVLRAFSYVSKRTIPYRIVGRRSGDVAICYANPLKAQRELSWRAEKGVEEMCMDTWRWQSHNPNGYQQENGTIPFSEHKSYYNKLDNLSLEKADFLIKK